MRDSVQEVRNAGSSGGKPAVLLAVINQPRCQHRRDGRQRSRSCYLGSTDMIPGDVEVKVVIDRSTTIRSLAA